MDFFYFFKILIDCVITVAKMLLMMLIPVGIGFVFVLCLVFGYYFYFRFIKKIKPIPCDIKPQSKTSLFMNLFVLWPKRMALDALARDKNSFEEFGIHIFVGKQGSGKTITACYLMQEWKKRYPKLKIYTNMAYKRQDGELVHWQDIINNQNGIYGVVNVIDEIQTWFSSSESKDVPSSMLGEICQQRKQKKAMFGTVQVFGRLAKPFREQVSKVYVPITFLGSLTLVRISKPEWYDSEKNTFKKYCGFFFFAHTSELRDSFDTYKRIQKYKDMEFSSTSSIIANGDADALHGDPSQ